MSQKVQGVTMQNLHYTIFYMKTNNVGHVQKVGLETQDPYKVGPETRDP